MEYHNVFSTSTDTPQANRRTPCKLCSKTFENTTHLETHVRNVHESNRPSDGVLSSKKRLKGVRVLKIDGLDYRVDVYQRIIGQEQVGSSSSSSLVTMDVKSFVCIQCESNISKTVDSKDFSFTSLFNLRRHIKLTHIQGVTGTVTHTAGDATLCNLKESVKPTFVSQNTNKGDQKKVGKESPVIKEEQGIVGVDASDDTARNSDEILSDDDNQVASEKEKVFLESERATTSSAASTRIHESLSNLVHCGECSASFKTKNFLLRHMTVMHGGGGGGSVSGGDEGRDQQNGVENTSGGGGMGRMRRSRKANLPPPTAYTRLQHDVGDEHFFKAIGDYLASPTQDCSQFPDYYDMNEDDATDDLPLSTTEFTEGGDTTEGVTASCTEGGGGGSTIDGFFNCMTCLKPFPTPSALISHQETVHVKKEEEEEQPDDQANEEDIHTTNNLDYDMIEEYLAAFGDAECGDDDDSLSTGDEDENEEDVSDTYYTREKKKKGGGAKKSSSNKLPLLLDHESDGTSSTKKGRRRRSRPRSRRLKPLKSAASDNEEDQSGERKRRRVRASGNGMGRKVLYKCDFEGGCDFETLLKRVYTTHKYVEHGDVSMKKCGDLDNLRPFACEKCNFHFKSEENLQDHIRYSHEGVKDNICPYCGLKFGRRPTVEYHIKSVHMALPKHGCKFCDYETPRITDLRNHIKNMHSSGQEDGSRLKHLKCTYPECNEAFSLNTELTRHVKFVHKQVKSYECEECSKLFTTKTHLAAHVDSIHLKIKAYVCHFCQESFSRSQNLRMHIRMVHERIRDFTCAVCKMKFGRKLGMQRHLRRMHGQPGVIYTMEDYFRGRDSVINAEASGSCGIGTNSMKDEGVGGSTSYLDTNSTSVKGSNDASCMMNDGECTTPYASPSAKTVITNDVSNEPSSSLSSGGGSTSKKKETNSKYKYEKTFTCVCCNATFGRRYRMQKHMRKTHGELESGAYTLEDFYAGKLPLLRLNKPIDPHLQLHYMTKAQESMT